MDLNMSFRLKTERTPGNKRKHVGFEVKNRLSTLLQASVGTDVLIYESGGTCIARVEIKTIILGRMSKLRIPIGSEEASKIVIRRNFTGHTSSFPHIEHTNLRGFLGGMDLEVGPLSFLKPLYNLVAVPEASP